MQYRDEALRGRKLGILARKQMVPATDKKAPKGREAGTDARVGHGPEGGACIESSHNKGWRELKGLEKGVIDGREQGEAGHEGGREEGGEGGGEQAHQESNLDPPSRDGGAPTPPSGHPLDSFIVLCTMRISYGL
jgi:hypothetical protein